MAIIVFLGGCTLTGQLAPSRDLQVVAGVPEFQTQERRDDCASVALASLLSHAGRDVAPAVIDAAVYDSRLGGALLPDLEKFAAGAGTNPQSGRGGVETLRQLLRTGHPVLAPIDMGWNLWRRPHYVVLYGFSDDGFLMHLRHGESRGMPLAEFERRWSVMGRLYLYLEP